MKEKKEKKKNTGKEGHKGNRAEGHHHGRGPTSNSRAPTAQRASAEHHCHHSGSTPRVGGAPHLKIYTRFVS